MDLAVGGVNAATGGQQYRRRPATASVVYTTSALRPATVAGHTP